MIDTTDKTEEEPSGKVFISDSQIVWEHKGKTISTIPIDKIKLIGEYTTSEGPVNDDWFIVFITARDNWHQISEYAKGMNDVLKQLSEIYNSQINGTLFASTIWKTNIIWPDHIKGKEMWTIEILPAQTVGQKIKKFIGLGSLVKLHLTLDAEKAFH